MFCSRSVFAHLLRGLGAAALLVLALGAGPLEGVWRAAAFIAAIVLVRGCPACWLIGLIGTAARRASAATRAAPRDGR